MNQRISPAQDATEAAMRETFAAQRRAFERNPCPSARARRAGLRALGRQLRRHQDVLARALSSDFGWRSPVESKMLDVLAPVMAINHAIAHVRRWMRPRRRATELMFFGNRLEVGYQPKGVVGIIVPWNFPVYLGIGPLAAALAAGNRAMIKLPEATPATNAALKSLLAEVFAENEVAVIGAELADPGAFASLPFDHLIFTGSTDKGRSVMRAAADELTPVTLELGGKSPAVVTRNYALRDAAARIAHGKSVNCGQVCVAPDYALVPREGVEAFVAGAQEAFRRMYPAVAGNPDYGALIHERHAARMRALLDNAAANGARVISCGEAGAGLQMPLHIVTGCSDDMDLMKEEIFGPILPVIPYDALEDAVEYIRRRPRPLALYCFSHDAREREMLLERTHSGGVTFNDWGWQAINHDAPFGGIGDSGMGGYHGEEGFRELSHARTVFRRRRFFPTSLLHPPYGSFVQRMALRLLLGKADPALARRRALNAADQ